MYLSITSTTPDATDLGYLLHKHPDRVQRFPLAFGDAVVLYPQARSDRCTAMLLLDIDPIGLTASRRLDGVELAQYINDRPYAASSMLAVAISRVFGSALKGECKARPDLVTRPLRLHLHLPAIATDGGEDLVRRLFAPLGWEVAARAHRLDPAIATWGDSRYVDTHLTGLHTVSSALSHLYILLPVLDGAKHYWVTTDEVDKLIRAGSGWLAAHPERDLILTRYLARQRSYIADAVDRLTLLDDDVPQPREDEPVSPPVQPHAQPSLAEQRRIAILDELTRAGAHRVADVGCGEGGLLRTLIGIPSFTQVVGVDVSTRALDRASKRLRLDRMPDTQRARLSLIQSSVTYRDARLAGLDAIVLMEVIEHIDPARLPSLERIVFGYARPTNTIVTTPNADYNPIFVNLPAGGFRHPDHRFEWGRDEFSAWSTRVAARYGYSVRVGGVGAEDPQRGAPSQIATFSRLAD